ncbi:tRNA(His) guanylyltransferase; AltName: Full=tRNA-histidine guanylyltransferase [Serendipita indica DSM 11827]|nr:tRNA(His) guanylyltransferase; AltName: Full=tRNA-histidine guanylyltransferase [Serendipita indica DSM 11827]
MANSKYAYVRSFELPDNILPGTYMIVRLDGHSFHKFSTDHGFTKPNDETALRLMDAAAIQIMQAYPEVTMAFGESDEFSKIASTFASLFAATYTYRWAEFFPNTPLQYPPSFDGRVVAYPSSVEIRDYFSWRQADTHINNLYNTTFWALVLNGNLTTAEAHGKLKGTSSSQKQEILFGQFGINYNALPERFRKGSVLYRQEATASVETPAAGVDNTPGQGSITATSIVPPRRPRREIVVEHCDIIGPAFWSSRPSILGGQPSPE